LTQISSIEPRGAILMSLSNWTGVGPGDRPG
jgi:hypothetical protein